MAVASNALFNIWQNLSGNPPRLDTPAAAGQLRPSTLQCDKTYVVLNVAGTYTFESAALNPIGAEFTVYAQAAVTANSVVLADGEYATFRVTFDSSGANQWSLTGITTSVTATTFADDVPIIFGTGSDVEMEWSTNDADNHGFVLGLGDTSQMFHITDKGAIDSDWAVTSPTHPTIYIHSNTTPITDYLSIGNHDGTTATINNVGGTTIAFAIAGTVIMNLTASGIQLQDEDQVILGTGSDVALLWSTADASDHGLVLALGDTSQMLHITDVAAQASDWAITSPTHPTIYIHSNTTPITDYLSIGNHDGTTATINNVGGTTLAVAIASTNVFTVTASGITLSAAGGGYLGQGSNVGFMAPILAQNNIAAAAGGAIGVTTYFTTIAADAGGDTFTLANGTQVGQKKKILFTATAGGTGVLTPTSLSGGTTITFSVAGDTAELAWNGTAWVAEALYNMATGAINTPVLA